MQEISKRQEKKLDHIYNHAPEIEINHSSRLVFFSDCHRGAGNWGDNFLLNQNIYHAALTYYNRRKFTYVELGDGDELWENKDMQEIWNIHENQFHLLSDFYKEGRCYMIYGNHDKQKRCQDKVCHTVFPGMKVLEGLVLKFGESRRKILLLHGHQVDFFNDELWRMSRFLVRHIWRQMELMGVNDPTSAAKNYKKKKKVEQALTSWAEKNQCMVIAGHTHRPVLPHPGEGLYFNDGSCIHPRCITALEIEQGRISLVKWEVKTKENYDMYVGREVLEGPYNLTEYWLKQR